MEHENEKETQKVVALVKENKMDGIDPNIAAMLSNDNDDVLKWLIVLGFLGRRGGLFGGGDGENVAAAGIAANSAKLDCLQQEHLSAEIRGVADSVNANIANLNNRVVDSAHSAEMGASTRHAALAAQLAECCCNLRAGHERIINELCKQTGLTVAAITSSTQRIVDVVNVHADRETQSKLTDCKTALSNCQQTSELKSVAATLSAQIAQTCGDSNGNGGGHGRGRGLGPPE